jgi:hypothetical protein
MSVNYFASTTIKGKDSRPKLVGNFYVLDG